MDNVLNNRTKKRKTRKCLNELRKKSRLCTSTEITNNHNKDGPSKRSLAVPQCTKVTKNRLTMKLGIFSKGVRSETITRPQLSEEFKARIDENLYKIIDLANGKPSHTVTSGTYDKLQRTNILQIQDQPNGMQQVNGIDNHNLVNIVKKEQINSIMSLRTCTPQISPPCFTPPNQNNVNGPQQQKVSINDDTTDDHVICIDSSTSQSKASSVDNDLFQYYKEFIEEVPAYLNQHLPDLMEDDTFECTREYLQRLYSKSCQRETEDNILDCINDSVNSRIGKKSIIEEAMEKSILLNPIEYLKHYGQQDQTNKITASTSFSVNNANQTQLIHTFGRYNHSSDHMVASHREGAGDSKLIFKYVSSQEDKVSSTAESSDTSARISVESHCVASLIEGSPEIRFYPRKLNQ